MNPRTGTLIGLLTLLTAGCASGPTDKPERGQQGTVAYQVKVDSTDPGARVEVNDDFVGVTPLEIKVWGDRYGTFHNFGSADFIIRVHPVKDGQNIQTKVFRTGGWFAQEDRVPQHLSFDLNQRTLGGFIGDSGKPRY